MAGVSFLNAFPVRGERGDKMRWSCQPGKDRSMRWWCEDGLDHPGSGQWPAAATFFHPDSRGSVVGEGLRMRVSGGPRDLP